MSMAAALACASNDSKNTDDKRESDELTKGWDKRDRFIALCMQRIDVLETQIQTLTTTDSGWLLPKPNRGSSCVLCTWQLLMTDAVFDNLPAFKMNLAKQLCKALSSSVLWLYAQHNVVSGHDELQCECILQLSCKKFPYQVAASLTRTFTHCAYITLPVAYEEETDCGPYIGRVLPICSDTALATYRKLFHKATVLQGFPNLKWKTNKHAWYFGGKYSSSGKRLVDEVTARELQQTSEWQLARSVLNAFDEDSKPLYVLDALRDMEAKEAIQLWSVKT